MMLALFVALGGGTGAALRFVVDTLLKVRWPNFPVGVLAVNVSGSFLLGLGGAATTAGLLTHLGATAWSVGLCGGYTTISTAMVDTVRLVQQGRVIAGLVNLLGATVACVLTAGLGAWLGLLWWG